MSVKEMLNQNELDKLLYYIEQNQSEKDEEIDVLKEVDTINPIIEGEEETKKSKKIVFKQKVREEKSRKIMETILNTDVHLNTYYLKVKNLYESSNVIGENTVEVIIFFSKGVKEKKYKEKIKMVLREIYEENEKDIEIGYRHILRNWEFEECLEFVLETISDFRIRNLNKEIFEVFKRNPRLRGQVAKTIFKSGEREYYKKMMDIFCGTKDLSLDEINEIKDLFISIAKVDESNATYLYKYYVNSEKDFHKSLKNIMEVNTSYNLNANILEDMRKKLSNANSNRSVYRKIIDILIRNYKESKNKEVRKILEESKELEYVSRDRIRACISDNMDVQIEIYKDKKNNKIARANALIDIAKYYDKKDRISKINKLIEEEEDDIFNVVALSIAVENGEVSKILDLFKYMIKDNDEIGKQAMHQIGRIKGLKNSDVTETLKNLCEKLLESEDDTRIGGMLKILDIYLIGRATDDIVDILLRKLKKSNQHQVQNKIIEFFDSGQTRFSDKNKRKIKEAIINCSNNEKLAKKSREYLRHVNKLVDATPKI
ncbi:MAG: hypothetical protein ACRC30_05370 [Clostridium sp.]